MKTWPNLELRARIARRRAAKKNMPGVPGFVKHIIEALRGSGMSAVAVPIVTASPDVDDDDDSGLDYAGLSASEVNELAAHVKECSNCKANLARAARSGAYIPEKLLIAAGIEILRN